MTKLLSPMIKAAYAMTGEEIASAMRAFYAASQTNCPWYTYALRHTMPGILATIGPDKPGYQDEAAYHKRFADYRIRGEWFRYCPAIMLEIDRILGWDKW